MSQEQKEYADGFYFKEKNDNAPAWAKGKMSVKVNEAIAYLQKYQAIGEEWLNFDLASQQKDPNKWSAKRNTWKPCDNTPQVVKDKRQQQSEQQFNNFGAPPVDYPTNDIDPNDIPF